jgi:CSLREA domain-containing protein
LKNDVGISSIDANGVIITSSIVANNSNTDLRTEQGSEVITSGGNNLIGDRGNVQSFTDGVNGDIVGTADNPIDPQLGELQDNGGGTFTQELQEGSPAIDAGSNSGNLITDQRGDGFNRTVGNGTDIGAFEVQDNGGGNSGAYVVTTLDDEDDGDLSQGDISLREAILNSSEGDTITFDSNLSGGTINLSLGELLIDKNLTIDGLGANNLTIDATDIFGRVFNIDDGKDETNLDVTIDGLTITGGEAAKQRSPGDTNPDTFGGGISNRENLNLNNSHVTGNTAVAGGGGIFNAAGLLTINNSTISDNYSDSPRVGAKGGGIYNETGVLTVNNSTISNNSAFQSGGILSTGATEINNSTISGNKATVLAGGINATGTITSSIVAGNINENNSSNNSNDLSGDLSSGGNNLIGDRGDVESFTDGVNGDVVGTTDNPIDPQLGELQDNGGLTLSQELLAGSPAIDTGSNPNNLATDQRGEGFNRTVGNGTDIGAFEVQDGGVDNGSGNGDGNGGGNPHPDVATSGDDTLMGTPCNDTIEGLEGNDILSGGDGNDTLYGGHGDDTLSGNNGNDVFALQSGQGADVILDFTDGIDVFGLTNGLCFGSLTIVNNDCGNGAIIQDATNNNTAIAFVNNIDAANITEHDFISI